MAHPRISRSAPLSGLNKAQMAAYNAVANQKYRTPFPYFSKVKLRAVRTGAGPFVYTVAQGTEVRAFSYGIGDSMQIAGFTAFDGVATAADTNLSKRDETISGEVVEIHGIAAQPMPAALDVKATGDPVERRILGHELLSSVCEAVSWHLSLNGGQNSFKLGVLPMIPGAGGISGAADAPITEQQVQGGGNTKPFATNGNPLRSNYFSLPEQLTWNRSGDRDSQLNIIGRVERNIILNSGGNPDAPLDDVAASNSIAGDDANAIAVVVYPEVLCIEILFHLKASVLGKRSRAQ